MKNLVRIKLFQNQHIDVKRPNTVEIDVHSQVGMLFFRTEHFLQKKYFIQKNCTQVSQVSILTALARKYQLVVYSSKIPYSLHIVTFGFIDVFAYKRESVRQYRFQATMPKNND